MPCPFDDALGGDVEGGFDRRDLDQRTPTRPRPLVQGQQQGDDGVHAGEGIAQATRDDRRARRPAGHPGHPGDLLHGLSEADPVPPGAAQAEGGHPHHDRTGVGGGDRVPVQPELLDDPRRVVLDDDVGAGDQPFDHGDALGPSQIEGHIAFGRIDGVKDPPPLPPTLGRRPFGAGEAHPVGPLDRFDLDDVGAEADQHVGRGRTGPESGQVDHPHPLQTAQGRAGGSRRPDRPVDSAVVLAEAGRGPEGLRLDTADAVRDTGLGERPVGAVNEHGALEEVVVGQHRLAIADRGDGNPEQGGLLDALRGGPLGRPLVDDSDDLVEAPGPAGGGGHHRVVEQIGPFDQDEKVPKLLSGRGREADEPVRGGGDRWHLDPAAGTGRGLAPEAGMQPGKRVQGDGHALEERYIEVAAPSRSPGGPHAGQGGDRGVDTADPLAEAAAGGQRGAVRPSPPPDRTGPPLEGELRRRPLRPRPAAAERGDRDNRQRRVGVEKALRLDDPRLPILDDQVGPTGQLDHPGIVGAGHDRSLGRVEKSEEQTVAGPQVGSCGVPAAQPVALGRLRLDHVGPGVDEQLGAVRTGDVARQVENAQPAAAAPFSPEGTFPCLGRSAAGCRPVRW